MRIAFSKFDGTPHWTFLCEPRVADTTGAWFFLPAGTLHERPDHSFRDTTDAALYVPWREHWCARFFDVEPGGDLFEVYVDVVIPQRVSATEITMIDMDLDVVRSEGRVWIDDEDEFAWNTTALDYPEEQVAIAQHACNVAFERMTLADPPFDRPARDIVRSLK